MQTPIPVGPNPSLPSPVGPLSGLIGLTGGGGFDLAGNAAAQQIGIASTKFAAASSLVAAENAAQVAVPKAVTITTISVTTTTAQSAGGSIVVTLRKNGVNTGLTLTINANAAAATFTAVGSVSFNAGDLVSLQLVNNDGANAGAAINGWSFA